jgi:hypothetical protein
MDAKITTQPTKRLVLGTVLSLFAAAAAQADPPGYEFMNFSERMALVVDGSAVSASGKAPKGVVSEGDAQAIIAGAQPLSGANIVLLYQGKVYIVPDKRLPSGEMASETVRSSAASASK